MTLQEYIKIPKDDTQVKKIGDKFRPKESSDRDIKVGSTVFFYEVIAINSNGYEAMIAYDKIVDKEQ